MAERHFQLKEYCRPESALGAPRCGPGAARSNRFRPRKLSYDVVRALFFNFRPAFALPALDRRLVALDGSTYRSLATPTQRAQNAPHMPRMKLLTRLSLDQIGHSPRGPQPGAIPQRLRAFFQSSAQLLQLDRLQPGFAARPPGLLQRLGPLLCPALIPATDRLAMNLQPPRDLSLTQALVKKFGRFEPPPFQLIKLSRDAFWITHAQRLAPRSTCVTILCDCQ